MLKFCDLNVESIYAWWTLAVTILNARLFPLKKIFVFASRKSFTPLVPWQMFGWFRGFQKLQNLMIFCDMERKLDFLVLFRFKVSVVLLRLIKKNAALKCCGGRL